MTMPACRPATLGVLLAIGGGLSVACSDPIQPLSRGARRLELTTPAEGAKSGAPFARQPVVTILDGNGKPVANSTAVVTMTALVGVTLFGSRTVTVKEGTAIFTGVGLAGKDASYTLVFKTAGLDSAYQSIKLDPGAPSKLSITTQPDTLVIAGDSLKSQPVLAIRDSTDNTVSVTDSVSVALVNASNASSAGGTLQGETPVLAVSGVATFRGLSITPAGRYRLRFKAMLGGKEVTVDSREIVVSARSASVRW